MIHVMRGGKPAEACIHCMIFATLGSACALLLWVARGCGCSVSLHCGDVPCVPCDGKPRPTGVRLSRHSNPNVAVSRTPMSSQLSGWAPGCFAVSKSSSVRDLGTRCSFVIGLRCAFTSGLTCRVKVHSCSSNWTSQPALQAFPTDGNGRQMAPFAMT